MGSPETFSSQESQKDKLIQSGIAKIAIDSLWKKIDILDSLGAKIEDLEFRVAYDSDEKVPQVTVEIPNIDSKTKDRVPKNRFFISDKTVPNFSKNLNEEQKQILTGLCEEVGVVVEEPDELVKERIQAIKEGKL